MAGVCSRHIYGVFPHLEGDFHLCMAFARRVFVIDMVFARSFSVIDIYRTGGNGDKFILQARLEASFGTHQVHIQSNSGFNISLDRFVCHAAYCHVSRRGLDPGLSVLARQKAGIFPEGTWPSFCVRASIALNNKSDNFITAFKKTRSLGGSDCFWSEEKFTSRGGLRYNTSLVIY